MRRVRNVSVEIWHSIRQRKAANGDLLFQNGGVFAYLRTAGIWDKFQLAANTVEKALQQFDSSYQWETAVWADTEEPMGYTDSACCCGQSIGEFVEKRWKSDGKMMGICARALVGERITSSTLLCFALLYFTSRRRFLPARVHH